MLSQYPNDCGRIALFISTVLTRRFTGTDSIGLIVLYNLAYLESDRGNTPCSVRTIPSGDVTMATTNSICHTTKATLERIHNRRAVFIALSGVFFFALKNVLLRYVEDSVPIMEVVCLNLFLPILLVVPTMTYLGISPRVDTWEKFILLCADGLIHTLGICMLYYALRHMRAGDATAISLSSSVVVGILGMVFLKEPFHFSDLALVLMSVTGVVLISQPPFIFRSKRGGEDASNFIAPLVASCSTLFFATYYILNRRLGLLGVSSFTIVLYYFVIGSLFTGLLAVVSSGGWSVPSCGFVRYVLVSMGILLYVGQCMITYSGTIEKSVIVALLGTNEMTFSYILEFSMFGVAPDLIGLIGALLIFSASALASLKKAKWLPSFGGCSRKTDARKVREDSQSNEGGMELGTPV